MKYLKELSRRHVFQVGAIYLVAGWLVIQIASVLGPALLLPDWTFRLVTFLAILGFPIALILAYAFELTPDGIKRVEKNLKGQRETHGEADVSVSDRPSIAVMPFANLSDDKDNEFLADGMTEDIITGLSYNSYLSVVSRNATFVYKNKPADLRDVGKALNVRYILEGSLRPIGERVRVTAQLIEASSGNHLWAEKFDRLLTEIFDVQDQVIEEIVGALDAQIATAEIKRAYARPTDNLDAWELMQKGMHNIVSFSPNMERFDKGMDLLRSAIEKDPEYAIAHGALSYVLRGRIVNGYSSNNKSDYEESTEHLKLAISLAPDDPVNLKWIGVACLYGNDMEDAVHHLRRSLHGFPNDGAAMMHLALALSYLGKFDEAHDQFERARRVAPTGGLSLGYRWYEALVLAMEGRFAEAEGMANDFLLRVPDYAGARMFLGLMQARQGRHEEARQTICEAISFAPDVDFSSPPGFLERLPSPEGLDDTATLFEGIWPKSESPQVAAVKSPAS